MLDRIINWFSGADLLTGVTHWLTSLAGDIAGGIEAGIVGILGDIWDVVIGPVLVILGAMIIIWTLAFAFRHEIVSIAAVAAVAK